MNFIIFITALTIGFVAFNKNIPKVVVPATAGDATLNGTARTAIKLGWISLVAWLLPIVGIPVTIVGLILAGRGRGSQYDAVSNANVHCAIGLALSIFNGWLGVALMY